MTPAPRVVPPPAWRRIRSSGSLLVLALALDTRQAGIAHASGAAAPDSTAPLALRAPETVVDPSAPNRAPSAVLEGATSFSLGGPGATRGLGMLARADARLPLSDALAIEWGTVARGSIESGAARGAAFRTELRARRGGPDGSLWLEFAAERDPAIGSGAPSPLGGLGGVARRGDVEVRASLEQTMAPVRAVESFVAPGDTLPSRRERTRAVARLAARLGARWTRGPLQADMEAGATVGRAGAPGGWIQSSLALALGRGLAAFATLGSPAPRWLMIDPAVNRRWSAGLRISPGGAAAPRPSVPARGDWSLLRTQGGRCVFQVRAPGARRMELAGDFTGWRAVAMRRISGTRWEVACTVPAGVHHLALRADGGEWLPPPGLPVVVDGFNGEVGLLVIE